MSIQISQCDDIPFGKQTFSNWIDTLNWKDAVFVRNDEDGLVYQSGATTITMHGYIAGSEGERPIGWDLNNSQIRRIEFTESGHYFEVKRFAMNLREVFNADSLDSFRNWRVLSDHGVYQIRGTSNNDFIAGTSEGSNLISAGSGNDRIFSTGLQDRIHAQAGDDKIVIDSVGEGLIWGGKGKDTFVVETAESMNRIKDFHAGQDVLDLRTVIKSLVSDGHAGDDDLMMLYDRNFSRHGVELEFDYGQNGMDEGNQTTSVSISVDGNVSHLINLQGIVDLSGSDMLL